MREVLQVVDVDGMPGRHDEPDLVVVEARVEGDLVRVVDVDRAVHPVDRRHILAPHGAVDARKQRVAHAVAVYRAHVDGVLRRGRDGDEGGPALLQCTESAAVLPLKLALILLQSASFSPHRPSLTSPDLFSHGHSCCSPERAHCLLVSGAAIG